MYPIKSSEAKPKISLKPPWRKPKEVSVESVRVKVERYEMISIPAPIPITGANTYIVYQIPEGRYMRPIIIAGVYTGTYNLDDFILWALSNDYAIRLDATQNRGTPFFFYLGHLDLWMKPNWRIHLVTSNHTVDGEVFFEMMTETIVHEA